MCGINAVFKYQRLLDSDRLTIEKMNSEMVYRGPDGDGFWFGTHAGLAMRRLAIIGIKGGNQPLFNEDRSLVAVCNGEIYNYPELRKELESRGHKFNSSSDCESILHLYEEYGDDCVHHLRGMFAFALWDEKKQRMLVGRDRVGEVPLYFSETPTGIYFSSELKAIAKYALTRKDPDYDSIRQTLRYSYPADLRQTFIQQIQRVLPGEIISVDSRGISKRKYWKPTFTNRYQGSFKNAQEDVMALLHESIDLRLRSDVPVAILLSGGIDSSALGALMAKSHPGVSAITAGYKGRQDCDESTVAEGFAKSLGLSWERLELDENDFSKYFDELTQVIDEPVGDKSSIAQWALYKKANERGLKVLLSGNGGDELFFGYPTWNRIAHLLDKRMDWERISGKRRRYRVPSQFAFLAAGAVTSPMNLFRSLTLPDRSGMLSVPYFAHRAKCVGEMQWPDNLAVHAADPFGAFAETAENGYDLITSILFSVWLPSNCLHLSNKLGLGNSVEIRAPLLDHKLVELMFSLPPEWRFKLSDPKSFFKGILKGIVPDEILNAKKRGFTPPDAMIRNIISGSNERIFGQPVTDLVDILMAKLMRQHFSLE